MKDRVSGVVNSLPMFFDRAGKPDFLAIEKYLDLLKSCGSPSLIFPMAYNTRIAYLELRELYTLHTIVQDFCRSNKCRWIAVPPYKASENQLRFFLEKLPIDENLYGASILFPERFYVADDTFYKYFSAPNEYGIKTVAHEMKMVSGIDGSLIDWPVETLDSLPNYCDLIGLKEDSKNDTLSAVALKSKKYDVIMAGGGVTQVDRLAEYSPEAWLAGVSLVDPTITKFENTLLDQSDQRKFFITKIETPFFDLCGRFGWHRIHKGLLSVIHGFPPFEPGPMSVLSDTEIYTVEKEWSEVIAPAIKSLVDN